MIGASGVGRSTLLSAGRLIASPSSSVRKRSWPSSLCMGWSDGEASSSTPAVEPSCGSVGERIERLLKYNWGYKNQIPVQSDTYYHKPSFSSKMHIATSLHPVYCYIPKYNRTIIYEHCKIQKSTYIYSVSD